MARDKRLEGRWRMGCAAKSGAVVLCHECVLVGKKHKCAGFRGGALATRFFERKEGNTYTLITLGSREDLRDARHREGNDALLFYMKKDDPRLPPNGLEHPGMRRN